MSNGTTMEWGFIWAMCDPSIREQQRNISGTKLVAVLQPFHHIKHTMFLHDSITHKYTLF